MSGKQLIEDEDKSRNSPMHFQVTFVQHLQERIHGLLIKMGNEKLVKAELQSIRKQLNLLKSKSQQVLVILQVMTKVRDELAYAQFDLEKSLKVGKNIEQAQKRVNWLEARLQQLLFTSRALCHFEYIDRGTEQNKLIIPEEELSSNFVQHLSEEQKERFILRKNDLRQESHELKMTAKEEVETEIGRVLSENLHLYDSSSSDDESEVSEKAFLTETDDQIEEKGISASQSTYQRSAKISSNGASVDKVKDYWESDHHRFEWVNLMQKLNPLSWHALAVSYPDSFLKRGEFSVDDIPWKISKIEDSDFDKKSLEKLQNKLKLLFQSIEDAAVNSVSVECEKITAFPPDSFLSKGHKEISKIQSFKSDLSGDERSKGLQDLPPLKSPGLGFYGERCSKLFSRPVSVVLPVVKRNTTKYYPRRPDVWCDTTKVNLSKHVSYIRGPRQMLKDVPTISKRKTNRESLSRGTDRRMSLKNAASKIKAITRFRMNTISMPAPDDLKWKRTLDLLSDAGIGSKNEQTALDAIRCLSKLGSSDQTILKAIRRKVENETNQSVLYEASKCLVLLGSWDPPAVAVLVKGLERGNKDLQTDILNTICAARNSQFLSKKTPEIASLINTLKELTKSRDDKIAFGSSLSLGHLCVRDSEAKSFLVSKLEDPSFAIRAQALRSLVRQMNCKEDFIIDALLHQISNANNWKHRIAAADLLLYIGVKDVTSNDADKVFDTLEKLLWNHPNTDLRSKIAGVINVFCMRPKAMFLVYKRLDDLDESLRSNAILMLSTLRMKSEKELKTLLDLLELDSSIYVRVQVVRAFNVLKWNDPRVIKSLQEREKGDGPLAMEAKKALASFRTL